MPRTRNMPGAILAHMLPGRDYSRGEICEALGLLVSEWSWAIRELKDSGRLIQEGERRGARDSLPKGRRSDS